MRGMTLPLGSTRGFALGMALLLMIAMVGQALTATINELNSAVAAYLVGESWWSKARESAALDLYRYSIEQDPALLENAGRMLDVHLGDRDARLALDQVPPDFAAARAGFLRGNNAPANVDRLIWLYRWFGFTPVFRDALDRWRDSDANVLRMVEIASELERAVQASDEAAGARLRGEIIGLDARMRGLQGAFLDQMVRAVQATRHLLMLFGAVVSIVLAVVAFYLLRTIVRRVRASEGSFRAAFEQAAIGMLRIGPDGSVLAANARACALLGRSEQDVLRMGFDRLDGSDGSSGLRALRERLAIGEATSLTEERDFVAGDGGTVRMKLTASASTGDGDDAGCMLALLEDVSDVRRLALELEHHASHDDLTGLANRRELQRRLVQLLARARRDDSRHALVLLDIDQFRVVNDGCGTAAGDEYLRRVAASLSAAIGHRGVLARVGGDEFAVVVEDAPVIEAHALATRLARAVAATRLRWGTLDVTSSASVGVVEVSADATDTSALLRAADIACGLAKEEGRNRVRVYVESDEAVVRRSGDIERANEVRAAIADRRIFLFAQPIRDLHGRDGFCYELFARLVDRDGRLQEPASFVPAVERHGQVEAFDREVVRLALEMLDQHPEHVRRLQRCHINVSMQSLASRAFRDDLVDAIRASSVPAAKLCFEVTEAAANANLDDARAFIACLQSLGCSVALDDFGHGLASFACLKSLPVDILKIDAKRAPDAAGDPLDRAVLRSISAVGRGLGKYTIVERVESIATGAMLRELGIDAAQGHAYGRPQPFVSLIRAEGLGAYGDHAPDAREAARAGAR